MDINYFKLRNDRSSHHILGNRILTSDSNVLIIICSKNKFCLCSEDALINNYTKKIPLSCIIN